MYKPTPASTGQEKANKLIVHLARMRNDWPSEPSLDTVDPLMVDALVQIVDGWNGLRKMSRGLTVIGLLPCALGLYFTRHTTLWLSMTAFGMLTLIMQPYAGVQQRYAVYALTKADDLRVLPTLIRATRYPWGEHPHVLYAIQRLLRQVTEEHVGLLNQDVLDRLDLLALDPITAGETFDYDLALVTLNVFAKVGGDRELRDVKTIAKSVAYNAEQRKIVSIAQQLVPVMEARLQRQQVPATLLRAADTSTSAPDTLLRATHATTPELPQQLLRASLSEHPETDA